MADEQSDKQPTVAYVPFKTFFSAVEALEHGLPHVIDRTVWPSMSGVMQSQVLAAFRFLGLIDREDKPTDALDLLVNDKAARKELLRTLIEKSYVHVVQQDLTKMSVGSFESAMRDYGITGETLRKACSFFLQAAKFTGIPLSIYLQKQTRNVSATRRRKPLASTNADKSEVPDNTVWNTDGSVAGPGPTKTIELEKGISLSLSTSADTFQMSAQDRKFVLNLLELLEEYELQRGIGGI